LLGKWLDYWRQTWFPCLSLHVPHIQLIAHCIFHTHLAPCWANLRGHLLLKAYRGYTLLQASSHPIPPPYAHIMYHSDLHSRFIFLLGVLDIVSHLIPHIQT
jgi:hypothetical protein